MQKALTALLGVALWVAFAAPNSYGQTVGERLQQIGIESEQGNLVAETHFCQSCVGQAPDWGKVETYLREQTEQNRSLYVLLMYNDRMQSPDLGALMFSIGNAERLTRSTMEELLNLLNNNCVALYWRAGNRGAFIQNPALRKDQLREQLEPLFR